MAFGLMDLQNKIINREFSHKSNFCAAQLRESISFSPSSLVSQKFGLHEIFPFRMCEEIRLREIADMDNKSICM